MACATCGRSILFGAKKAGERKYCSKKCLSQDELGRVSDTVSEEEVSMLVQQIRDSNCPSCENSGNIEMFKSYFVYSFIIYTSWKEKAEMSCRACAKKRQIKDLVASFFLGWWGFPFGILATPIIIIMNIGALLSDISQKKPSKEIRERARLLIASDLLASKTDA